MASTKKKAKKRTKKNPVSLLEAYAIEIDRTDDPDALREMRDEWYTWIDESDDPVKDFGIEGLTALKKAILMVNKKLENMALAGEIKNPKKKAKRNAKKRTKKKVSTRRVKATASKLKKVKPKDYEIVWDKQRESCHFGHKKGMGGEIGSGINDVVEVYTDGKFMYVLSLNYTEGYACVEAFDGEPDGSAQLCFALPKDIEKLLGKKLKDSSPSDVMTAMYIEMQECEM